MNRGDAINEVRKLEQTLVGLGVKDEPLPRKYLENLSDTDMTSEIEALNNQIKQRTEFIGNAVIKETKMSESEKAPEIKTPLPACQRSIIDIVKDLSKPVAQKHLSTRKQGGKDLTFISWYHAEQYLDYYAAGWSKEIKEVMNIAGKVAITVRLSIPCLEGVVIREATGCEDETTNSFGDSFSNAESMALRRACANFGLGRHLYEK